MSKIEKVKEIMGLGENFHMCDVSEIAEDHIHLESWDEDVNKSDFDLVAELIASDMENGVLHKEKDTMSRMIQTNIGEYAHQLGEKLKGKVKCCIDDTTKVDT